MTSPALTSIRKLRHVAAALEEGRSLDPDDAAWLADKLGTYFESASRGLTIDLAFELSPAPGQANWWLAGTSPGFCSFDRSARLRATSQCLLSGVKRTLDVCFLSLKRSCSSACPLTGVKRAFASYPLYVRL